MRTRHRTARRSILGGSLAALLLFPIARATDEPIRTPADPAAPGEAELRWALEAAALPVPNGLPAGPLVSVTIPPEPSIHRGAVLTDAGPGEAGSLTPVECAKLDAARAAVEAARAAGTLEVPCESTAPLPAPDGATQARKLEQQRVIPELTPNPVTGVGVEAPAGPKGPLEPTPEELAKLEDVARRLSGSTSGTPSDEIEGGEER